MRAETLCLPFLVYSVHVALSAARGTLHRVYLAAFILGLGCAWAFLIKYNLAVLVGFALPFVLYAEARRRPWLAGLVRVGVCCVAGASLLLVPFAWWGWNDGWLMPCVREYLINTAGTISKLHSGSIVETSVQKCALTLFRDCTAFLLICIMGAVVLARVKNEPRLFRLAPLVLLLLYVLLIYPSMQEWTYYSMVIVPFCMLPVCCIVRVFQGMRLSILSCAGLLSGMLLLPVCWQDVFQKSEFFFFQKGERDFILREAVAHEIPFPRVLNLGHESAFGITAGSLPACRYWSLQVGASDEMIRLRREAIRAGIPDFVKGLANSKWICYNGDYSSIDDGLDDETRADLKAGGYREIFRNFKTDEVIYGKADATPREISQRRKLRDILLKRPLIIDNQTIRR